jgi:hypothetical protein
MTVAAADSPKGANYITKAIGALFGRMTPAEQTALLADAAVSATLDLAKATDLLEDGDDGKGVRQVTDQFDSAPDNELKTVHSGGPGSRETAGDVGIGRPQDASGAGAARMESEYSRHASQYGVQRATEMLGAKLAAHGRAMKSLISFGQAMSDRIGFIEKSLLAQTAVPDQALVDAAVAKALPAAVSAALAKALPAVLSAVAKAKAAAESGEDDKDDEDDEAKEAESGSGTDVEIVNEMDDEDDALAAGAHGLAHACNGLVLVVAELYHAARSRSRSSPQAIVPRSAAC